MQTWGLAAGFKFVGKINIDMLLFPLAEKEKVKSRRLLLEMSVLY
ncbi:MAG: hypothetical protein Q8942_18235 [Bacillota bacterium]|nr:hypothetical protein [Bacillota bacterium]